MKQFVAVMQSRKLQIALTTFIISIAIWLIGPYIAVAGKIPLASPLSKIAANFFALVVILAFEYRRNKKLFEPSFNAIPDEIKQELQTLQKTLQDVLRILYKNFIKSFLFRYRKPWFLVLGPTASGKTTFLNKADLNLKGLDNLPPLTITPTKFFNWWIGDEAVFIDVGGRYLRDNSNVSNDTTDPLFQGFFKILKKYRRHKPINGLILTINLQELTVNIKEQSQLKKLQRIINELIIQFMEFPIYLIITRCDVIEGFTEFFEDLGPEERNQIFGISFPLSSHSQSLPQLFHEEYNTLLTRLNERILWRLHHEHNLDKLGKIKNFPLQMEFLKNPLAKLLNLILPHTNLNLRGIYFISALQKDVPFDNLTQTLARAYDITHINSGHRTTPTKNFFITEIFRRIIFPEIKFFASNNSHHRYHILISLIIVMLTGACTFFFYNSYKYNEQLIHHTEQALYNLKQQTPTTEDPLINNLNILQTIISQSASSKHTWYTQVGMQQSNALKNHAIEIYKKLLGNQFLSYLQGTLESQLQSIRDENTNQLYATLKAYLMLGDMKHFDKKFFQSWFENHWQQTITDTVRQKNLKTHLAALLEQNLNQQTLNHALIENTRTILNSMPQSRLVLTILQNQYQGSPIKLLPESKFTVFKNLPTEVAGIYSIENFRNVYYTEILNTCREITNGDWVLGKKAVLPNSNITLNQLSQEVKAIYLNEYALVWNDLLTKVKIEEFQNLEQLVEMLDLLNNSQSPLAQLINTIKNNTQPLSDSVEFTQQVSSRFLSLNTLSADILKNTNQGALLSVKEYLNKIVRSPDIDKSSYEAAKVRMEIHGENDAITTLLQQARTLPEPLKTWHMTIATESWRIILKNTQNYLNKIWIATVYPQFVATLNNRYPLFKDSTTDIPLADFANFFAAGGTMDMFFKNYLQPFVDNSRLYWEWKNVDNQRINIPQNTLEMFIRAALIQKMFFPEDTKLPTITFSLVPVELTPNVQNFTLVLDGQIVTFQKENEQIITLNWPGSQPNHCEIAFTDLQGKKSSSSEVGPWSWFRILDKAHLESTTNPKHYKLSFNLNGNIAQYELYTNGIVNPFIPGILNAFRCPENLN